MSMALTPLADAGFDSQRAERRLCSVFNVKALDGFGAFGRAELAAAGALLDYLELTQRGALPRLAPPRRQEPTSIVQIDAATRRNLELAVGAGGEREGSLLAAVDRTLTGAGARLLAARLAAPLTDPASINKRLDIVAALSTAPAARAAARDTLRRCPDLERALSRIALGRGGPRDLLAIATAVARAAALRTTLADLPALASLTARLEPPGGLADDLTRSLVDEPPLLAREGGFIRQGVLPPLDELRSLRDAGRQHILALEERYRREVGVPSLKIRYNNLIGWYVELASAHEGRAPGSFIRRQSMAGAIRYATAELSDLEARLASASGQAVDLELDHFRRLCEQVLAAERSLTRLADALAEADVACALAELAVERRYVRPCIDDSLDFTIEGGRHPVVEQALARVGQPFIANDCALGGERSLWLLTGPNMAGKSTFLRQNALIALLAQAGSFVPATSAHIGVVDRLFSRVGAGDDLARGRSTFMVEMIETAAILNQAGQRSLVILDEIGRGTATYDGLSIAWAVVEHLHEVNRCRALFATHYHELTALAARLDRLACHTLKVKEWKGEVVFLHEVGAGTADRSYGIHVARLAGLPEAVLRRAETVLRRLEAGEASTTPARLADDLPLFAAVLAAPPAATAPAGSLVEQRLRALNPDALSPREALDLLYELRGLLLESGTT
jgi:DNA mismatch repair protein MutS